MALNAAVVWDVRTTGNDTNGGGFRAGAAGTDYSQQDAKNTAGNHQSTTDAVANGTTLMQAPRSMTLGGIPVAPREDAMAERTVTLTNVTEHPDGRFEIVYNLDGAGGIGTSWPSKADALVPLAAPISDEMMVFLLLAYWNGRSTGLTNPSLVLNKALRVDFAHAQPVRMN
jgi:hypothetical protein